MLWWQRWPRRFLPWVSALAPWLFLAVTLGRNALWWENPSMWRFWIPLWRWFLVWSSSPPASPIRWRWDQGRAWSLLRCPTCSITCRWEIFGARCSLCLWPLPRFRRCWRSLKTSSPAVWTCLDGAGKRPAWSTACCCWSCPCPVRWALISWRRFTPWAGAPRSWTWRTS